MQFIDRSDAGSQLATHLMEYKRRRDVVVLALPRGGVPVAFEIARELEATLDVLVVRKVGAPTQPELALGAVASGGVVVLDSAIIHALRVPPELVDQFVAREETEVKKREELFRDGRSPATLADKTVILVDDGAATGSTMLAAAEAVRQQHAGKIVAAVPVASRHAYLLLQKEIGHCVCLATPEPFNAVSERYKSFVQVGNDEVRTLLRQAESLLISDYRGYDQISD